MTPETKMREDICTLAASMFDCGLTNGAPGNISARLEGGGFLVTPTGSTMRSLDPARLSWFDAKGQLISSDSPTKKFHFIRPSMTHAGLLALS